MFTKILLNNIKKHNRGVDKVILKFDFNSDIIQEKQTQNNKED